MSINELFIWTFTIVGLINFIHLGLYISGANIYDIVQPKRTARPKVAYPPSYHPHVTVLIPAHNEEKVIIRTLEAVNQSSYDNMSVVVIDDASTDKTATLVSEYIAKRQKKIVTTFTRHRHTIHRRYSRSNTANKPICLLTRPANGGKAAGLNYALQHAVQGGLAMTLDADSILDKHAIERAVRYFHDPRIVGVAANVKIMQQQTPLGMLQKFEHMIGYRSKKFYTLTNSEFIVGGVASTYRYETLKKVGFYDTDTATEDIGLSMKIVAHGNRRQRIIYAADVVATTEGVQSLRALIRQRYRWKLGTLQNLVKYRHLFGSTDQRYSRGLTFYRMPMAFISEAILLIQPFLIAYLLGLSLYYHTFGFWIGGYATITLYILWTIWPDEHHTLLQKLVLSLYAPGMYFCFFVMDTVQVLAICQCLLNIKQITGHSSNHIVWTSPERLGSPA